MKSLNLAKNILFLGAVIALSACGGSSSSDKQINIKFSAKLNGSSFSCGNTYNNVGSTASSLIPKDLRFYVSNINLIDDQGKRSPLQLDQDGEYQDQDVALVDLENAQGSCSEEGNASTHSAIVGSADGGNYTGVSFTLGVPFALNHSDTASALPPLNSTAMGWNWNAGRKFFKLDFNSNGMPTGYSVHLGSTGCTGNSAGAVNACTFPNRVDVTLNNFNPDTNTVVINLDSLLSGENIDFNTPQTAPGCMSGQTDPECRTILPKFGLPVQEIGSSSQKLFTVE